MELKNWEEEFKKVGQCLQRQDSTTDQLTDLIQIATKLGFYDAADFLKTTVGMRNLQEIIDDTPAYIKQRTASDKIAELKENEIFVFGSNESGFHGGGAAALAHEKFGAEWGVAEGVTGQSYAIPTKSKGIKRTLTIEEIKPYVNRFITYAMLNPKQTFLVTEIGCGLAGHIVEDIAPLFKMAIKADNVHLPRRFWEVLEKRKIEA